MKPLLDCANVSKTYSTGLRRKKVDAVRSVSFCIEATQTVGLIGANGAGKTTTIKMIMGLVAPTRGTIHINGIDSRLSRSRSGTAFMPEVPYLYENLTVQETLDYVQALERNGGGRVQRDSVLEQLGLEQLRDRRVGALSKGNRQRVSLAQALVGKPSLLVLDEPMSGMDPPGRELFRTIFCSLNKAGTCILFSTHILEDVERLCDRVIMLDKGTVAYDGAVGKLLNQDCNQTAVLIPSPPLEVLTMLQTLDGVTIDNSTGELLGMVVNNHKEVAPLLARLAQKQIFPVEVRQIRPSLHQMFTAGGPTLRRQE